MDNKDNLVWRVHLDFGLTWDEVINPHTHTNHLRYEDHSQHMPTFLYVIKPFMSCMPWKVKTKTHTKRFLFPTFQNFQKALFSDAYIKRQTNHSSYITEIKRERLTVVLSKHFWKMEYMKSPIKFTYAQTPLISVALNQNFCNTCSSSPSIRHSLFGHSPTHPPSLYSTFNPNHSSLPK